MILFKKSDELSSYINKQKASHLKIGFVPTMGALHAGHLSLVAVAKQKCDIVVCSIFVNPTQFNQASDLASYPRTIANDIQLLISNSCDVLYHPDVDEVYGNGLQKESSQDFGPFIHVLEGASRPGHFDGVVTVLRKLFISVGPDEVFFGQKDYQQCLVVKTLINRSFPSIKFNICPIERESDGLAMSSRNVRLSNTERSLAPIIFKSLQIVEQNWQANSWQFGLNQAIDTLKNAGFVFEYLAACDPETLEELNSFQSNAVVLVAVQLGSTRLIDNILIGS
ncbi:MAG: pantoate--beta-alanine ligase [Bacteroidia bacterium]|nr:pantoate--beta-alanine ligase [Bacteroidia bacterium]